MLQVGDITYTRTSPFNGTTGTFSEGVFRTRADALDYSRGIRDGSIDRFLANAWERMEIRQRRDPNGKFAAGWTVQVSIRRPVRGESYDLVDPEDDAEVEVGPPN